MRWRGSCELWVLEGVGGDEGEVQGEGEVVFVD
jgi:hypothetical protein